MKIIKQKCEPIIRICLRCNREFSVFEDIPLELMYHCNECRNEIQMKQITNNV